MNNTAKTFEILATDLSVLQLFCELVQQNYFSGLYPANVNKNLDFSAKPLFPYMYK